MRKHIFIGILVVLLIGCSKQSIESSDGLLLKLKTLLSPQDFIRLQPESIVVHAFGKQQQKIVRARLYDKEMVAVLSSSGQIIEGRLLDFDIASRLENTGTVTVWNLDGSLLKTAHFIQGRMIPSQHPIQISPQSTGKTACTDCTIPEVIVAASYKNGETHHLTYYSMSWLFGSSWGYTTYMPVYADGGGGGGPVELDPPLGNPDKIDPKKYTDCFDQIGNEMATYSMTIYSDLPADQHPGTVFDHKAYYAGHSFIELNKSNPFNSARQVFGFYPGSRFGALSGGNTTSKIVDDSGHEYQASYTITVSQSQFNAAVQRIQQLNSQYYNITNFNCVDFALSVFQAGGGHFSLQTQYNIPVYGSSSGNNTPNGLYEQIATMHAAGVPGTTANANKNYGPNGKGPCE